MLMLRLAAQKHAVFAMSQEAVITNITRPIRIGLDHARPYQLGHASL